MDSPGQARKRALEYIEEALNAAGIRHEAREAEPVPPAPGEVSPAYLLVTEDAYSEATRGYDVTVTAMILASDHDDLSDAFAAVYAAVEVLRVSLRYDGFVGTEGQGGLVGGVESYVVEGV